MPLNENDSGHVADFFDAIAPFADAYRYSRLTFVAVRRGPSLVVLQARLFLQAFPPHLPPSSVETPNIAAGAFPLEALGLDPREFAARVLSGQIATPIGPLLFPHSGAGHHTAHYTPFHQDGLGLQSRLDVLRLTGTELYPLLRQPHFDWELRAAPNPYESLQELLADYRLGSQIPEHVSIEIVAPQIVEVDFTSEVRGTDAVLKLLVAEHVAREDAAIGYRVLSGGAIQMRGVIPGRDMEWQTHDGRQHGRATIQVPNGAVLQCFATFKGSAQHAYWIADPTTVQNPRRAIHEAFDPQIETLKAFLRLQGKGKDARDLEVGVAWLLWMLGFSVSHLGGTSRTQDAADLIAISTRGDVVVVECTTGLLKADQKLPLLVDRAQAVRRRLNDSGNRHVRLLPAIVTSKTRDEIRADLEQAERLGVLVVASEDIEDALRRTIVVPNSDALFAQAEQAVQTAREKYTV